MRRSKKVNNVKNIYSKKNEPKAEVDVIPSSENELK